METIFLKILNMSIAASWLVAAVVLLRLILKRAPKIVSLILWALVGIRLVMPITLESVLSLIPSAQTVPPDITTTLTPSIHSGLPLLNSAINPIISQSLAPTVSDSVNPMQVISYIATIVWIAGLAAMLLYSLVSYVRLRLRVRESVRLDKNVMLCDNISSPFILGIIKPRIYIPSSVGEQDMTYVLAHENAHLRRRDHFWKPLGFLLLSVYWFNPVMWVAYILLCRDIELACDEKVIKSLGVEEKKPYSTALVNCSVSRKAITICPLAFGEVGVKKRVKTVLNYKKPAFWIIIVALITCVAVAVCFLTNPKSDSSTTTTTTSPDASTPQSIWTTNPRTVNYNGSTIPYTYDEAAVTWLTFSKTEHSSERDAVKTWLRDELSELNRVMGDSYYDPEIYIAKYDIDNNGTTDYLVWLGHIAYSGSAGNSLYIMYSDGVNVVSEEYIANFRLDASTIEAEGNKQVGIYPAGECNDIYILGKIWMRNTATVPNTSPDNSSTTTTAPNSTTTSPSVNYGDVRILGTGHYYNIDGDRFNEFCMIMPVESAPYDFFRIVILGNDESRPKYYAVYSCGDMHTYRFVEAPDGKVKIAGINNDLSTTLLDISVENGRIVLSRDGKVIDPVDLNANDPNSYYFDYETNWGSRNYESVQLSGDSRSKEETVMLGYMMRATSESEKPETHWMLCVIDYDSPDKTTYIPLGAHEDLGIFKYNSGANPYGELPKGSVFIVDEAADQLYAQVIYQDGGYTITNQIG